MRQLLLSLFLAAVAVASTLTVDDASAQASFKWVDKNGKVQYSDHPPAGANAALVQPRVGSVTGQSVSGSSATSASTSASNSGSSSSARPLSPAEQEQAFRRRQLDRQDKDMKQSKATEQAEQRTDACNNARSRMAALDAGGRQMRFNERGERYFLDDRMVANERASAQREATQSCG